MITENIEKIYSTSSEKVIGITDFSYSFEKGKFYAIMGHSGSGKSTLIRILGLMDNATSGKYVINDRDVSMLSDKELSNIRMENIGFIFQDYYLDENLRAYENVMLPMLINKKIDKSDRKIKAIDLLKNIGLGDRVNHYPKELSGGEQQRVCIARAIVNEPKLLICDEPTGNLDPKTSKGIMEVLETINKDLGTTIIMATHDKDIVNRMKKRVIVLDSGVLAEDHMKGSYKASESV